MSIKLSVKVLTAGLVALGLASCHKDVTTTSQARKVAYFVAANGADGTKTYTGVIHARTESSLGFRVAGKIVKRLADPGDKVKAGQPLMRIDATDYALALNAANADVEAAMARKVQATADEVRLKNLLVTGAVSKQAYEQVKATADAASAQLLAAQAQARVSRNQADYAVLVADADGVVMDVVADVGQVVSAGQTVVTLAKNGAREAVVDIPEASLANLGKQVSAYLYSDPNTTFSAKLREISSAADPLTRTYQARYILSGNGEQAPLGATVSVRIAQKQDDAATNTDAPIGALIDKGQGTNVWIVDPANSTVHLRPVTVRSLGEEIATISAGIKPGEKVVAFGAQLLKEGEKVDLLAPVKAGS
jgi:RND family efflux transporter MFP subunit